MRQLWRRPSPAMVVACLALLVALSGTGIAAATQVARNSVGTPQLKDSAVTNALRTAVTAVNACAREHDSLTAVMRWPLTPVPEAGSACGPIT